MSRKIKITKENWAQLLVVLVIALFLGLMLANSKQKPNAAGGMPPGGFGGARGAGGGSGAAANTVTVSAKTVKPETIVSTVHVNGDISSKSEVNVYPLTSGKVSQLKYNIGDSVNANDVIAYVDPSRPGAAYAASPVKAPVGGTIIECNVSAGDTVNASTAIAKIGSLTDLEIVVYVSEKYAKYLEVGLPAYLSLTAYEGERFPAAITAISPVVAKNTRTIKVTLALLKHDKRVKPGMFAAIDLVIQKADNTTVLPKKALRAYNDEQSVFVINPETNTAERVIVTVGLSNDKEVQITSGLSDGQKVVTAGSVTEGSPVHIADES